MKKTLKNIIVQDFVFYRKQLTLLSMAFALSSIIICGALITGDSLKFTLQQQIKYQFGNIKNAMLPTDVFVGDDLLDNTSAIPIIYSAVFAANQERTCHAKLIGVNKSFFNNFYTNSPSSTLTGNRVWINKSFAGRLNLKENDSFVIRQKTASSIMGDSPFSNSDKNYISLKLTVQKILKSEQGGNFAFYSNQRTPDNVFIDKQYYGKILEKPNQANSFLTQNETISLSSLIGTNALQALGFEINKIDNTNLKLFSSKRYFIEESVTKTVTTNFNASPIFTYLASDITSLNQTSSYAFVTGLNTLPIDNKKISDDEIVLSTALTNQLNISKGSKIRLSWFSIVSNRWQEMSKDFTVSDIVDVNKIPAQLDQSKNIPGIGDADNCLDWQTDFPINMDKIKDEDEVYWNEHKGLPKAFISYDTALKMWRHHLGNASGIIGNFHDEKKLTDIIITNGGLIQFTPIYHIGYEALKNSTNFSQLFIGLSFTLIGTAIFFSLTLLSAYLNKRRKDIGIFISIGYSHKLISQIIRTEILFIILFGVIIGLPIGILYSNLLLSGISNIWSGAFESEQIMFHLKLSTILITIILSIIPLFFVSTMSIKKFVNSTTLTLLKQSHQKRSKRHRNLIYIAITSLILTGITLTLSFGGRQEIFSFIAGILFLPTLLSIVAVILQKMSFKTLTLNQLGLKSAYQYSNKTLRYIASIAFATFMIIAIGGYKTNLNMSESNKSANAGFDLIVKTAVPIKDILKNKTIKQLVADNKISVMPIKTDDRSEADCSNVYNVTLPTIFGVPTTSLIEMDAFKFKNHMKLKKGDKSPWNLLKYNYGENIIPAFADYNVMQWSLQLKLGETLEYVTADKTYKIKLVGALDRTIFQGGIIISKENFTKIAPTIQGYTTFFIKSNNSNIASETPSSNSAKKSLPLEMLSSSSAQQGSQENLSMETVKLKENSAHKIQKTLNIYGPQVETTENYLKEMAKTQDSYLTIFMALGYIALLIGLAGTNIIFLRNIQDNTSTIIFLREIGYSPKLIRSIISKENLLITFTGIIIGTLSAFIALIHSLTTLSWITFSILILSLLSFTLLLHILISRKIDSIK